MKTLRLYTRSKIGDKVVENEVEVPSSELTYDDKMEMIKLILGIKDDG